MVSALRLRATHPSGDPATAATAAGRLPDGASGAAIPAPQRPRGGPAPAASRRLRGLTSFRRFGLGVSIAGAMAASAIGGGLLAARQPSQASVAVAAAAVPNGLVIAASGADAATAASAHDPAPAASVPASAGPAAAPAAEAVEHASAESSSEGASPGTGRATALSLAVPDNKQRPATSAPTPAADMTFGLDVNGDGIPDSLERFVRKAIDSPATRVAARRYYRVALPLAAVAEQGEPLTVADQNAVYRAAECYLLSAAEDGLSDAPNLNVRASIASPAAARRMQALAEALHGFDYRVGGVRRQTCS